MTEPLGVMDTVRSVVGSSFQPDDRRGLITKILQHQDLDSLLRLSVVLCDHELQGDGCSLFLYDVERSEIVLKESTVLTRFLGQRQPANPMREHAVTEKIVRRLQPQGLGFAQLDHTLRWEQTETLGLEMCSLLYHFGVTRWTFWTKCPLVIDVVHDDIRWSSFELPPNVDEDELLRLRREILGSDESNSGGLGHCELPHDEIGSIAIVNIGGGEGEVPRAVLRIVRHRDKDPFGDADIQWMMWLAGLLDRYMQAAISLSDLTDLGTQLEVEDFGRTLVRLLQRVLRVKGCSIFLEMEPPSRDSNRRVFPCIATTGLIRDGRRVDQEARYEVEIGKEETEHLTSWALSHGQLIALTDVHNFSPADFPGLHREPGGGEFSETDAQGQKFEVGPILISPLFLHQGREVAGAIRISRRRGEAFEKHEQLLFLDISRRLSRVLTNLHLRQVSEKLIKLYDAPEAMLERVPREICRLLEVEGCSVLLRRGNILALKATAGALRGREGGIEYDIGDAKKRGWTGWVAYKKKALLLNSPEEAKEADETDPPRHAQGEVKKPCETGEPAYRFLAVPIFRNPEDPGSEVLGVVRVPRKREDPPFEEEHQSILVSFAARLSLALNLARRNEQLEAVVKLPNIGDSSQGPELAGDSPANPTKAASRVVERAVDVLIEKLGFDFGAIFMFDKRTGEIRWRHGRCALAEQDACLCRAVCYSIDGDNVHARIIRQREAESVTGWEPGTEPALPDRGFKRFVCPILLGHTALGTVEVAVSPSRRISEREQNMVRLLAGFCANALYSEAVFRKLDDLRHSLVTVGPLMTVERPLQEKLAVIAEAAARVTQADNVIIHEYVGPPPEQGNSRGRFRNSACGGPRPPGVWREVDQARDAVPFRIVESKQPEFAAVARGSQVIFHEKEEPNFIQRESIRSVAGLPLTVQDTCVGCIFFNFASRQDFDAQQRQEIEMMAEYAAVAIYQGRLLEETKKLTREKSNLLRYAEHSLNQPLNALLGFFSNLAAGVYNQELSPEILRVPDLFRTSAFGQRIRQQYRLCEYLCYLVETFLHIDRLETELRDTEGEERISRELFTIRSAKQDLSALCQLAAGVGEAYLFGSILQEIEPEVSGLFDENAVQISLLNILVNAVKHGRPSDGGGAGVIRLTLAKYLEGEVEWAEILVEDSGPGVPPDERERIFERHYRRGNNPGGLGIGLFLTRGYVEAHGGRVSVRESAFGGACFIVHLPLAGREEDTH